MGKSKIKLYWRSWYCLMSLYFLGVLIRIPILNGIPALPFLGIIFFAAGFVNIYEGRKFENYIKQNHLEIWKELTNVPFFGSGNMNSLQALKFLRSKDTYNDDNIIRIRKEIKQLQLLLIVSFFSIPVSLVILVILHENRIINLILI